MVVFNCNACGESLKKNQVEKHYKTQCRRCEVLSCVDCGTEFWGDAYEQHIKCISEEEKYSGKNYKPKPNANKGEQKQESWTQQVQDAIAKVKTNPRLKDLLERLRDYPNIPRKKAKFENFLKNSLRVPNAQLATQAWDAISAELPPPKSLDATTDRKETLDEEMGGAAENDKTGDNRTDEDHCDDVEASQVGSGYEVKVKMQKQEKKKRKQDAAAAKDDQASDAGGVNGDLDLKQKILDIAENGDAGTTSANCDDVVNHADKKKKSKKSKTEKSANVAEHDNEVIERKDKTKIVENSRVLDSDIPNKETLEKKKKKGKPRVDVEPSKISNDSSEINGKKKKEAQNRVNETVIDETNQKSRKQKRNEQCGEDDDGLETKSRKKKKNRKEGNTIGKVDSNHPSNECEEIGDEEVDNDDAAVKEPGTFNWEAAIIGILKRASDNKLSIKKLKKKVLGEFYARNGDNKVYTEEKLYAKFSKKINKNSRLKVFRETVSLNQ